MIHAHAPADSTRSIVAPLETFCDRLAHAALWLILVTVSASVVLGVVAVAAWPELRVLGSGAGGANGIPAILILLSIALGAPSFLLAFAHAARGERRKLGRLLPFVGPAMLFFSFFFVSHAFDPCALGLATWQTTVFGTPLCQAWGGGWEISTRFHLLHHAVVPTVFVAYGYWAALKRWHPAGTRFDAAGPRSRQG